MFSLHKPIFTALFLSAAVVAASQSFYEPQTDLYKFADSNIALLKAKKIDSIICFYPMPSHIPFIDSLGNIGPVLSSIYSIHKDGNRTILTKYIQYWKKNSMETRFLRSQPLKVKNDTLFTWFKSKISKIENEIILPFIFSYTNNGITSYEQGYISHSPVYEIYIHASENYIRKTIEDVNIHETYMAGEKILDDSIKNLNYEYNCSTTLYTFHLKLKNFLESIDRSFIFKY